MGDERCDRALVSRITTHDPRITIHESRSTNHSFQYPLEGYDPRSWSGRYSLMLERLMISTHFFSSALMNAVNSAGEEGAASMPRSLSCCATSGDFNAATSSLFRRSTMAGGVFTGASRPYQLVAA